ncbi:MAG: hypothetical protein U0Y82_00080 [Thermoleophilia bacterium]
MSVAVGVIALLAGIIAVTQRSTQYTASASVILNPTSKNSAEDVGAIDTLSRDLAQNTVAQALAGDTNLRKAFGVAGITSQEASQVSVDTSVVASTSKIYVNAHSSDARLAERAANAVAASTPDLSGFLTPYELKVTDDAQGTAAQSGAGTGTLLVLALLLAVGLGLLTFAVLSRLARDGRLDGLFAMVSGQRAQ